METRVEERDDERGWDGSNLQCQICGVEESATVKIVLFDNTKIMDPMFAHDEAEAELCETCAKGIE